jgi:RNA polymerase sporulation-specific sigma factor
MIKLTDEIIENCEALVNSIVKKYVYSSDKEDLIQAGMEGVIEASKIYDSNYGVKFTTFAYKYISGAILDYLRKDRNIKIGRDLISDYKKVMIAKEHIYKTYGRPASEEELSKILCISIEKINEIERYNKKELSINMIVSDDEKITLADTIYNKYGLEENEKLALKDALEDLDEEEKELIYRRYFQNMTQTEVAKRKNMSQVKVYRLERKVLDKLRDKMS